MGLPNEDPEPHTGEKFLELAVAVIDQEDLDQQGDVSEIEYEQIDRYPQ